MPGLHPFLSKELKVLASDSNAASAIQDTCWLVILSGRINPAWPVVWLPGDMRGAGPMCCSVALLSDACSQALQADAADTGLQIASRLMTGASSTQPRHSPSYWPGLFLLRVWTDLGSDWMRLIM